MAGAKRSADPICSSCYCGFLPVVDHLRSLSARGHTFHEPCIQQLFASCWKEEISYCPDSKANVRRFKSHSVANSCHCGETLEELRQEVNQLKGSVARKYSARKTSAEWSRKYRRRETMRRLHDAVMRLQSKVTRLEHLQKDRADDANKVHMKREPCDLPTTGNVGFDDRCTRNQFADLANSCNKSEFAKASNLDPKKRNLEGSDNLKAESNLETGPPLGSVPSTTTQCNDIDELYSFQSCLTIINGMQGLHPRLYTVAQHLFENPSWRKIFVSLKREKRLTWLISMLPGV